MTGDKLLKQCRREMRELIVLRDRRDTIEASLLPRAIQYTHDRIQVSPDKYFEKAVAAVVDMEMVINEKIAAILERQKAASGMIDTLTDSRHREVLTLYYLTYYIEQREGFAVKRLYTLEDVAVKMNYSNDHVRRLQSDALAAVDR